MSGLNKNVLQQRANILKGILQKRQWFYRYLWGLRSRSAKTMEHYSGTNWSILAHHLCERPGAHPIFATFNAIKTLDFQPKSDNYNFNNPKQMVDCMQTSKTQLNHVKRGETGAKILFFKYDAEQEDPDKRTSFSWTTVFSISQCEGEGVERLKRAWEAYERKTVIGTAEEFVKHLTIFAKNCRLASKLVDTPKGKGKGNKNSTIVIDVSEDSLLPIPTVDTTHAMNMADLESNVVNLDFDINTLESPTIGQCVAHIQMMIYAQLQIYGSKFHLWKDQYDDEVTEQPSRKQIRNTRLHCGVIMYQVVCALAASCGFQLTDEFFDHYVYAIERKGLRQMDKLVGKGFDNLAKDPEIWQMVKRTFAVTNALSFGYNKHQLQCRVHTIGSLFKSVGAETMLFVDGTPQLVAPEIYSPLFERCFPFIQGPKLT